MRPADGIRRGAGLPTPAINMAESRTDEVFGTCSGVGRWICLFSASGKAWLRFVMWCILCGVVFGTCTGRRDVWICGPSWG